MTYPPGYNPPPPGYDQNSYDPNGYGQQPQQPPPPGPYAAPYMPVGIPMVPVMQVQNPGQGMGVTSMVLGIIGLVTSCFTFGVFSLLAVIFGHVGLSQSKRAGQGNGMATAGLTMGYIVVLPALAFSILVVGMGGLAGASGN